MAVTDVMLQVVIYFLSVFGILFAIYILTLDQRNIANRYLSAILTVFAVIGFGAASFISAGNVAEATLPSYILATGAAVVNPFSLLVTIALIKPNWLTGRRRWSVWLIYGLIALPLVLIAVDLLAGTRLWYTGLDSATYQGGLPSQKEYFSGALSPLVTVINFYITPSIVLAFLIFGAFFDKTISEREKHIAWILLAAQVLIFGQFAIRLPIPPAFHILAPVFVFDISYTTIALGRLVSDRALERMLSRISLRRKLQAAFGFSLVILLLTNIMVVVMGVRIQTLLTQLQQINADTSVSRTAAITAIEGIRLSQVAAVSIVTGGLFSAVIVSAFVFYVLGRQIIEAITDLRQSAEQLGDGDLTVRARVQGSDEIAVTANALNTMTDRLQELLGSLEDQVKKRTQALETTAEISRQTTAILNLSELLKFVVNRIQSDLNFYYVHIYLIDPETDNLVMAEGSGEVGRLLKAKGHRLKAGQGIVGTVASLNQHFISNNVHEAINWVSNPLLPDTNAELAVPLRKGQEVLGVLDVQSAHLDHFSNEDVALMQSLANQTASAIDNARQLARTQEALKEVERLNRRLTHQVWEEFGQEVTTSGYRFVEQDRAGVRPASGAWLPPMKLATAKRQIIKRVQPGNSDSARAELAVPLILRGEVIGALGIKRRGTSDWTSEEQSIVGTVADQIARALESARLSEEQARTIDQLKEVDRLKTGFLTSMSHELRTPLNSIIGFADILLQGIDGPLTDNAVTDVTAIHNSGKHLLALINDILDLSKIEAGRMELVYGAVSVPIIFREVTASVSSLLKEKPVNLIQRADYSLPKVWVDPLRFSQIVINLVSNAIKFTEEGTVVLAAEVLNDHEMRISIKDTGIGIPEDQIDLIFERFRQVDSRNNRKYQGTGMGLAISRQLVEMHNGQMWVESTIGKGTTFHFTVDLAPDDQQQEMV